MTLIVLGLINSSFLLTSVEAKPSQDKSSLIERIKRFFFGTSRGKYPGDRDKGGATRGDCPNQPTVLALVPKNEGTTWVESTISGHPTFWFYISPLSSKSTSHPQAEFKITTDKDWSSVYSYNISSLPQEPGIIGLQLANKSLLQTGHTYRWTFSFICNSGDRAADATVKGWLKRISISSNLRNQLNHGSDREKIKSYIDSGLWYETLTSLAKLQRSHPQDKELNSDWSNILHELDLPDQAKRSWTLYPLT